MLDLGGAPSASNDSSLIRTVNASKNSKLQAVAFDFDLLTRSFDEDQTPSSSFPSTSVAHQINKDSSVGRVEADLDKIRDVASLLKVSIDTTSSNDRKEVKPAKLLNSRPQEDIRAKYAKKLAGGLAGIELAKSQVQNTLARGDAGGHLAAKKQVQKMASPQKASNPTRWMAMTGSGKLLSYLTHRSIKIALLPDPKKGGSDHQSMQDLTKQLPEVVVDVIVDATPTSSSPADEKTPETLTKTLIKELDIDPNLILLVSDRDEYLRSARDLGMITCKLQRKNTRRGNITVHYSPETLQQVQEVVNEINGISFNAVLNR